MPSSVAAVEARSGSIIRQAIMICCLLWAMLASAYATEIPGRVIGVSDGDTLIVLDAQRVEHRVRLQGIDAPELRQPFGQRARQALSDLVFRRDVLVKVDTIDRHRRPVGVVYLDGEDVNQQMIEAGMAWHFKQYQREQTPAQRRDYAAAEEAARKDRRGLWAHPNAVPPWEFRRAQRQ